jgi:hypothetical protein
MKQTAFLRGINAEYILCLKATKLNVSFTPFGAGIIFLILAQPVYKCE